jgi:ribonuclease Z
MRRTFLPRLVNEPFSDPGLYIPFRYEKRALLFDLGSLENLSAGDLLKITHVFVTHTHMDHFVGLDSLLRLFLGRDKTLHLFGPPGFFQQVEGRLAGYTWNLVHEYETDFLIHASEISPTRKVTKTYMCREAFRAEKKAVAEPFSGTLLMEPSFCIRGVLLDHGIPCLGLTLQENFSVNIIKEAVKEMGLPVGPWLNRFKKALYEKRNPETPFRIAPSEAPRLTCEKTFELARLAGNIARISPGQKITYVTDVLGSPENCRNIIELAKSSDHLFVEAAFLQKDQAIAKRKYHLTAQEAGLLGRKAGVKQLHPFHFSPRYEGRGEELVKEVMKAFGNAKCQSPNVKSMSKSKCQSPKLPPL